MAVVDRSVPVAAPPNEQGFKYLFDFEAGDSILIRPNLRTSLGRVSIGWTLDIGAGASVVRDVSMQWPDPEWVTPPEPDEPYATDWVDYEDAPFTAMRFTQTGGAKSTLSIVSRWAITVEEG